MISGSGWMWARVRGGDSLELWKRERLEVLSFGGIYGSKVVIIVGGIGVREAGRRGGKNEGVDRWAVKEISRAKVRGVSLSDQ